MTTVTNTSADGAHRAAGFALAGVSLVLALLAVSWTAAPVRAAVPTAAPTFSNSLDITNPYFRFRPGAVKVFVGREGGEWVTSVETHLATTRQFTWNGATVTCRVVQELQFVDGGLADTGLMFVAQADDGTVYTFGEVEDGPSPDDGKNEPNGWIVGARRPSDPPNILSAPDPAIFMPASPEKGDSWHPKDVDDDFRETYEVRRAGGTVRTPAGRFGDTLRIKESTVGEPGSESVWFAPDIGIVKFVARGKRVRLYATTLSAGR